MFGFDQLGVPLVVSPMAGGPSTPELAAAAANAGALGFLAAGNLPAAGLIERIDRLRQLTANPFGVNVFVPTVENVAEAAPADRSDAVAGYRKLLAADAERYGVTLPDVNGNDTDDWSAKLEYLLEHPVAVVSFTFGLPERRVFDRLHAVGTQVIVTVTDAEEALAASDQGADGLAVQGPLAGGHRGTHAVAKEPGELGLDALLASIAAVTSLPRIAAGGVATREGVEELLADGATAVQLGTVFLRADECGASPSHKDALASGRYGNTAVTRAFTGRPARGLVNRFLTEHDADAIAAYPEVNLLTRPLRAAAAAAGDPDGMALWAGTGFAAARALPAADILADLAPR
ncbi:MAG TPA: nitronate monooxygenase [Galbitalea sp.]